MNKDDPKIINFDDIFSYFIMLIPYALKFFAIVFIGILGEFIISESPFSGLMCSLGLATCFIIKELKN
ncbi:hypothetical protein [Proteiniclasticum sp. QWL-01]|uniref:hypothetical protein n=1 Tax=Proteiniclasticum sp. QWL-01 TaxID=3036945 RepID=UPI00240FF8F3|nr:hypothetical protein [Proteiniclasticum sp. QWL-01]WFF71891.1 hypothetical protein P6M73_11335 [Proteiniclasticum sp. QWL-01]